MKILFIGGLGDIWVAMSYIDMAKVKEVYWATRRKDLLAPILSQLFPHIRQFCGCDFADTEANYSMAENLPVKDFPDDVVEWSPIQMERRKSLDGWHLCPLLTNELTSLSIDLPERFWAIQPYTPMSMIPGRDFDKQDWEGCIKILEARNMTGVVLDSGFRDIPSHPLLINLQRQTTIAEAVEVVKRAEGMISVDSCLSVLGAQLFLKQNLRVKCCNTWFRNVQALYYHPQTDFSFVTSSIRH